MKTNASTNGRRCFVRPAICRRCGRRSSLSRHGILLACCGTRPGSVSCLRLDLAPGRRHHRSASLSNQSRPKSHSRRSTPPSRSRNPDARHRPRSDRGGRNWAQGARQAGAGAAYDGAQIDGKTNVLKAAGAGRAGHGTSLVSSGMVAKTLDVTPQAARRIVGLREMTGRGGLGHGECYDAPYD